MVRKISMAEKVIREAAEYILAFLVIIECNSLFSNSTDNYSEHLGDVCLYVAIGILAGLVCYYFVRSVKVRHNVRHFAPVLVLLIGYVLLFYRLNVLRYVDPTDTDYLYRFLLFLPFAALYFWCKRKVGQEYDLFLKMADLICLYALLNLVVYITLVLRPDSVYAEIVRNTWETFLPTDRPNYYNLMVCRLNIVHLAGHAFFLPKNIGFYTEPPMYGLALNFALCTEMFLRAKKRRQIAKWVILSLAMITTQAVLGMVMAVFAWGIKAVQRVCERHRGIVRVLEIIGVVILALGFVYLLYQYKSAGDSVERGSFDAHFDDYKVCLAAFLNKPLLGGGYDKSSYIVSFMSEFRQTVNPGFTNSVFAVLAEGGIMLGVLCMLPFFIGLWNVFTKRNKETAAWALGMFGCYCVMVFQFRMLLLLIMAYGYSCVYVHHGLKIYDTPSVEEKPLIRWNWVFLAIAGGISVLMIFFGQPVWSALRTFLLKYQLYLGQSAPRLVCFLLLLITAGVVFRECMRRKRRSNRLRGAVSLMVCLVLYSLLYTRLRELVNVQLVLKGHWSEGRESIYLYLIFLIFLVVCMLVGSLRITAVRRHLVLTIAIPAAGVTVFAWFFLTLPDYYLRCVDMRVASDMKCISLVTAVEGANLYADEEPRLYRAMVPELGYSATTGNGHLSDAAATVIISKENDCRDLFNAGWLMTPISEYSNLYSNQPEVITALQGAGYTFYSHYPLSMDVDKSNSDLDHSTLQAGTYTVAFHLHIDRTQVVLPEGADDLEIGNVSVGAFYNFARQEAGSQTVRYSAFDENGDATVSVTFYVPDCMRVGYYFDAAEGITCDVQEVTISQTPSYDVRQVYNGRRQVVLESYYDGNGNPVTLSDGYGNILYGYDQDMNTISITYLDIYGNIVNNTSGYAQLQRAYDSRNHCIREAYYAYDGTPVVVESLGYSAITRVFDENGDQTQEQYYGADGNLIANGDGVAAWSRTYDENGNTLSILYYGADGNPVIIPSGYAEIRYSYDEQNHKTSEAYYGTDGQPIQLENGTAGFIQEEFDDNGNAQIFYYIDTVGNVTARNDGIAKFHRQYDANNRVTYEAYFDAGGNPFAVDGGYCATSLEYDDAGNVTVQKYYDAEGNPMLTSWGYAEIHWTYNDQNQRITESYYGTDGNPMTLPSGQASDGRAYDGAGNLVDRKFYDLSGNLVMTTDGYAEIQYTYDENNQVTSETHLDTMGNVVG